MKLIKNDRYKKGGKMTISIRPANERGTANFGWLNSKQSFSFGQYYDPKQMGFGNLRVINEDRVEPGRGFGTHGHRDMEIISVVLEGALEHKDSIGNGSIIRPGDIQRISAGTGVLHSEYNASNSDRVHFLQIWIFPEEKGLQPSYEQKAFTEDEKQGKLRLVGSREGREGSVKIHQDADLYVTLLGNGEKVKQEIAEDRSLWVQVARGKVLLNDRTLETGDGAAISQEQSITIAGISDVAEVLVFDLKN